MELKDKLQLLSNLYGITIDRIVKEDDECNISLCKNASMDSAIVLKEVFCSNSCSI